MGLNHLIFIEVKILPSIHVFKILELISVFCTSESLSSLAENDILTVGPGVLGRLVAQKWRILILFMGYLISI